MIQNAHALKKKILHKIKDVIRDISPYLYLDFLVTFSRVKESYL